MDSQVNEEFLAESKLIEANHILQLNESVMQDVCQAANLVREQPMLRTLAISCAQYLRSLDAHKPSLHEAEFLKLLQDQKLLIQQHMGQQAGFFKALLVILALPELEKRYRLRNIPQRILIDTMKDLRIWMQSYYKEHGSWGLDNLMWLLKHLSGRLYRLGRLQYIHTSFGHAFVVLRHVREGTELVLSESEIVYRQDGQVDGTNGIFDENHRWTAVLQETSDEFIGNPIRPDGKAEQQLVTLHKEDWRIMLRRGDPILEIHIPEDGKLSIELCRESFRQANEFYPKYFPEKPYQALVCTSWLMDPQFQSILPQTSNIVRFQQEFYLLPVRSTAEETFERVFGTRSLDPGSAARDTALKRAIVDYVAAGHHMRGAAGFILTTD